MTTHFEDADGCNLESGSKCWASKGVHSDRFLFVRGQGFDIDDEIAFEVEDE